VNQWKKEEIKGLRKYLVLTQKEFAKFLGEQELRLRCLNRKKTVFRIT
jgi:DNA-binding transcriptional regulator YiaG